MQIKYKYTTEKYKTGCDLDIKGYVHRESKTEFFNLKSAGKSSMKSASSADVLT